MKFTKKFFQEHYIKLGKTSEQIGKEVGLTGRAIRYHLTNLGFGKVMRERLKTGLNRSPVNKGKFVVLIPKLGRRYININNKSVPRYRYFIEQHLGRKLRRDEIVHHKDGNPLNDSIDNLQVMSQSEHIKLHNIISHRWIK